MQLEAKGNEEKRPGLVGVETEWPQGWGHCEVIMYLLYREKNTFFLTTYEIRPSVWGHCLNSSQRNNVCEGCPLSLYRKECKCVPGPGLVKWACTSSNDTERPWPKFLGPMGITRRHHVTFHTFYKNGWIYKLTALREIHASVLCKTPASSVSSWWCQPQAKAH